MGGLVNSYCCGSTKPDNRNVPIGLFPAGSGDCNEDTLNEQLVKRVYSDFYRSYMSNDIMKAVVILYAEEHATTFHSFTSGSRKSTSHRENAKLFAKRHDVFVGLETVGLLVEDNVSRLRWETECGLCMWEAAWVRTLHGRWQISCDQIYDVALFKEAPLPDETVKSMNAVFDRFRSAKLEGVSGDGTKELGKRVSEYFSPFCFVNANILDTASVKVVQADDISEHYYFCSGDYLSDIRTKATKVGPNYHQESWESDAFSGTITATWSFHSVIGWKIVQVKAEVHARTNLDSLEKCQAIESAKQKVDMRAALVLS
eukprot:TRINITY_DN12646_c2_g2_i1.p1 TRINITY_DN12646_c2_g2~~TRINITY_DN12646_c2_g2_i1.p1  ORF type:complete len:315 (+),score=23.01 TRINITY_DN12646_c2_g2_i1:116-1060(+)